MLRFTILVLLVNISFLKGWPIEKKDGIPESKIDRAIASAEMPGAESFSEYPFRPYEGMMEPIEPIEPLGEEQEQIMEEEPLMEPLGEEPMMEPLEEPLMMEPGEVPLEEETVIEEEEQ